MRVVVTVYDKPRQVEVNLSASQLDLCERLGLTPERYAKFISLDGRAVDTNGITQKAKKS